MTKEKINILHLRDSPWVDGPGRTILETATKIDSAKYGYFIGALCKRIPRNNSFIQTALERNINAFRIDESCSIDPLVFSRIKYLLKSKKIDIIHTHEMRSDVVGLITGKMTGIPVITTLHGWIQNSWKGRLFTKIDKNILRFFDHIICVSEKISEEIQNCGVRQDRVTVLHNALVIENFRRNVTDRVFRKEIQVDDNHLLVGNIGRLSPEKGQADFIKAASTVLKKSKDVRFVIIGKGNDEAGLRELAQELDITNEVIFAGYREDIQHIYNSLDLVVQSSYTEGMPNVVLEVLAMEVPVIATDVGGTSEAIESNETGVLISPGKPDEMAEKILLFIQNRDMFKEMAQRGKKHVETNFNFDERTRRLSGIYDRIGSRARCSSTSGQREYGE